MNKSNYTAFYIFTFFVIQALFIDIGSVLYVNRATIVKAEFNVTVYSSRQLGSIGRTYVYVVRTWESRHSRRIIIKKNGFVM